MDETNISLTQLAVKAKEMFNVLNEINEHKNIIRLLEQKKLKHDDDFWLYVKKIVKCIDK